MREVKRAGEGRLAFRSLSAVMNKEFIHIIRDPGTLFISLIIPVFLLLLFGYALSLDVKDVPFCLVDMDRSVQSRDFVESFTASACGVMSMNLYQLAVSFCTVIRPCSSSEYSTSAISARENDSSDPS